MTVHVFDVDGDRRVDNLGPAVLHDARCIGVRVFAIAYAIGRTRPMNERFRRDVAAHRVGHVFVGLLKGVIYGKDSARCHDKRPGNCARNEIPIHGG